MILRRDPDHGAAILSIPRDLWVPIAGRGDSWKINAAFNGGADQLIQTIQQSLGIPIHHYIEVDFDGFARLVDTVGGIEICVHLRRPGTSGLDIQPGCQTLNGGMALAFVRSRKYEEWIDGEWVADNKNDFGRMERQQTFLRTAATAILDELATRATRRPVASATCVTVDAGELVTGRPAASTSPRRPDRPCRPPVQDGLLSGSRGRPNRPGTATRTAPILLGGRGDFRGEGRCRSGRDGAGLHVGTVPRATRHHLESASV